MTSNTTLTGRIVGTCHFERRVCGCCSPASPWCLDAIAPGCDLLKAPTSSLRKFLGFLTSVEFLIVLQIVGHVVVAALERRHDEDERDKLIWLKGTRKGSVVLGIGVFLSLWAALAIEGNFLFTHLLPGFWVLAELVEIGTQLVLYRRGT